MFNRMNNSRIVVHYLFFVSRTNKSAYTVKGLQETAVRETNMPQYFNPRVSMTMVIPRAELNNDLTLDEILTRFLFENGLLTTISSLKYMKYENTHCGEPFQIVSFYEEN